MPVICVYPCSPHTGSSADNIGHEETSRMAVTQLSSLRDGDSKVQHLEPRAVMLMKRLSLSVTTCHM